MFYDQPINDLIKQYDEAREISTGQGDDHTTGYLLDYAYFRDHNGLIEVDLSKQKELDADSRANVYSFRKIKRNNARILLKNIKSCVNRKILYTVK